MKKILLLLSVIVMLLAAFTHAEEPVEDADIFSYLKPILEPLINAEVPLYGNEKANFYTMDGEEIGHAITSEGFFTEFDAGAIENATMNVYVDNLETVKSIVESEDQLKKFYELKGDGNIKIEPIGAKKKVKFFFTNILGKIASWFT